MRRGFTLVELLVVIVIIAALAGLTAPMVIRQRKKADQTEAVNNAHQIGLALLEFDTEYGSYPDPTTALAVTAATGKAVKAGDTSNARFHQLFAAGMTQSEAMFYAKAAYTKKPDGIITAEGDTLAKGEVGFGIISNGVKGFTSSGNPGRPICAAPFTVACSANTFDKDFYDSKAVVLKMDNSVTSVPIKDDQSVSLGGFDIIASTAGALFDGSTDTKWLYPDPK